MLCGYMYQTGNYTKPKIIETHGCPIRKTMRHKEIWNSFLLQQTQQLTNSPDWGHIIHIAVNSINHCIFSRTHCLRTSSCMPKDAVFNASNNYIGPGPRVLTPTCANTASSPRDFLFKNCLVAKGNVKTRLCYLV